MKKFFFAFAMAIGLSSALVACGNKDSNNTIACPVGTINQNNVCVNAATASACGAGMIQTCSGCVQQCAPNMGLVNGQCIAPAIVYGSGNMSCMNNGVGNTGYQNGQVYANVPYPGWPAYPPTNYQQYPYGYGYSTSYGYPATMPVGYPVGYPAGYGYGGGGLSVGIGFRF